MPEAREGLTNYYRLNRRQAKEGILYAFLRTYYSDIDYRYYNFNKIFYRKWKQYFHSPVQFYKLYLSEVISIYMVFLTAYFTTD